MMFIPDVIRRVRQLLHDLRLPDEPERPEDPLSEVLVPLGRRPSDRTSGIALTEPPPAVDVMAVGRVLDGDRR
jgi:hypothetical protein